MVVNSRRTICMKAGGIIYIGILSWSARAVQPTRDGFMRHVLLGLLLAVAQVAAANEGASDEDRCSVADIGLDHIIWVVPELAAYATKLESMTGVTPTFGGEHSNGVTANYLLSLGDCTYLEIAGPRSGLTPPEMGDRAETYAVAHAAGFALGMRDAQASAAYLKRRGLEPGDVRTGGREKPDGTKLSWRTVSLSGLDFGKGTFQFAIEWLSEPHPARTAPGGVSLDRVILSGPSAASLAPLVADTGVPFELRPDAAPDMAFVLATPNGHVTLD